MSQSKAIGLSFAPKSDKQRYKYNVHTSDHALTIMLKMTMHSIFENTTVSLKISVCTAQGVLYIPHTKCLGADTISKVFKCSPILLFNKKKNQLYKVPFLCRSKCIDIFYG